MEYERLYRQEPHREGQKRIGNVLEHHKWENRAVVRNKKQKVQVEVRGVKEREGDSLRRVWGCRRRPGTRRVTECRATPLQNSHRSVSQ